MPALSFVALELQTTHLDPATVSQASYVKLVQGNITRVDSWPVIPPTANDAEKKSSENDKTWAEALSQLNMVVGQLPVVSYYRDADKEVFQAASKYIGETPPEFRWLDCRELARKYMPNLPEFQLSTVMKALHLFEDYGDSDSVEQTTQIVLELARREDVTSIEELWGDLYDQPDKLLGLEAGLDGLDFAAEPDNASVDTVEESEYQTDAAEAVREESQDETHLSQEIVEEQPVDDGTLGGTHVQLAETEHQTETVVEKPEWADEEVTDQAADVENETQSSEVAEPTPEIEQPVTPVLATDAIADETVDVEAEFQHGAASNEVLDDALAQDAETVEAQPDTVSEAAVAENATTVETPVDDGPADPIRDVEPSPEFEAAAVANSPADDSRDIPADRKATASTLEAADVPERATTEQHEPEKSPVLRTMGFFGIFGFGLLTIIGLVLTVMAAMLFFTDNNLLLETKIAGIVLTGAISLLSLLMTAISYRSFRNN